MSFAVGGAQSIGLSYIKPAADVMQRAPRPPGTPILSRRQLIWLITVGAVMAIGTLGVVSWAQHAHGTATARTMGMVTLAHFTLYFSFGMKAGRSSVLSRDIVEDRTFVITTGVAYVLLVLSTVLGIFHTVLGTTTVDVRQWLIGGVVALLIVLVAEIRKSVRRRSSALQDNDERSDPRSRL